jgi:protein-S-isoprenylcysteine O-methyltransferase Ste14
MTLSLMRAADALELKVPPPVAALACAGLMWLARDVVPPLALSSPVRIGVALATAAAGIAIDLTGFATFHRAHTTINPMRPAATSSLVTRGIFAYTRNPMYVGLALQLLGWAAYLANPLALAFVAGFVAYVTRFQIVPEERVLARRFGREYAAYRDAVRRWL